MANNVPVSFHDKKITIIGLGLIGGSLARIFSERLGIWDITAINRSQDPISHAINDGVIIRGFSELNEYVYASDIIFICTPVKRAIEYIKVISPKVKKDCIITDVGSTKGEIVEYINKMVNPPCFIGGHPMAGTEKTGYAASFSHLFENAFYVLSPGKSTSQYALELMLELVQAIGAIPVVIDAQEHDRATACISHVPHIIASALVNMVAKLDSRDGQMQMLAAGGFRDITRIASSSPEMWENIILSNKYRINEILDYFIKNLEAFKIHMDKDNSKDIYNFFETAKNYRDSLSTGKKGLLNPVSEIIVDIIDEPGKIGEIATLLGKNGVNIKNINVSNSRELEQGCLKITLADCESMDLAFDLLLKNGYKVFRTL
jgi:prephenate dehydrogenase